MRFDSLDLQPDFSRGTIDTIVTMVLLTYYGTIVTIVYLGGTIINITNTINTNITIVI